jgi:deoxyxylulose-5-phosphate synthase
MAVRLLDSIDSPAALKVLTNEELSILAAEIRDEIVAVTSQTGGHVASSLGAVEIILALHSLLDCPKDRIVFDVGHQAYAHMLVTGRRKEFSTLRQYKGLSGFPKPNTSPYDVHFSGHASDSISVALDDGCCIVGDLVPEGHLFAYGADAPERRDWDRITATGAVTVCHGHGPAFRERLR